MGAQRNRPPSRARVPASPVEQAAGEERRVEPRHIACFPAHIQRPSGSARSAVIRDVSVTGALLLTRATLKIDETVGLHLYLSESSRTPRVASGRVVRVETRDPEHAEVWPFSVAVQFDEPLVDCALEIKDLAARQEAIGLPKD